MQDAHGSPVKRVSEVISDGVELCPGGAVMLTDANTMVVADLHLGCEAALEYKGLSIPRVQTRKISEYLSEMISTYSPDELVIAGDLKHNFSRNLVQEWRDVAEFVRTFADTVSLRIIRGNHDYYLGAILAEHDLRMVPELAVGRFIVAHGHRMPSRSERVIIGHVHPSMTLRDDTGAQFKSSCFLYEDDREILVLSALSVVSPGIDVIGSSSADSISPVFSDSGLTEFVPIAVSEEGSLRFPKVGVLRGRVIENRRPAPG